MDHNGYKQRLTKKFGVSEVQVQPGRVSMTQPLVHTCSKCGTSFRCAPRVMLTYKNGHCCSSCDRVDVDRASTQRAAFQVKLQRKFDWVRCENYVSMNRRARFVAQCCGTEFDMTPKQLLGMKKLECCGAPYRMERSGLRSKVTGSQKAKGSVRFSYQGKERIRPVDGAVGRTKFIVQDLDQLLSELRMNQATQKASPDLRFYAVQDGQAHQLARGWEKLKAADLVAFVRGTHNGDMRILALDPGVTNFAWSVLQANHAFEIKIIASGMVRNTLRDLKVLTPRSIGVFLAEIQALVDEYQTDSMILERYMSRRMGGTTIELVNIMIGALFAEFQRKLVRFKFIPSAQWKNEWNRIGDLEQFYTQCECVVHQVDAIGIGMYGAAFWTGNRPYSNFNSKFMRQLAAQINETNTERGSRG